MMVLTFVLSQCFIVKLLKKPILSRIFKNYNYYDYDYYYYYYRLNDPNDVFEVHII